MCTSCRAASAARSTFAMCFGRDTGVRRAAGVGAIAAARPRGSAVVSAGRRLGAAGGGIARVRRRLRRAGRRRDRRADESFEQRREIDRRVRLAQLRRALRRPRDGQRQRREPLRLALQQPVRRGRRLRRRGSCRPAIAGGGRWPTTSPRTSPTSTSTTPPRSRGLQRRLLLAHRSTTSRPARPRTAPIRGAADRRAAGRARSTTTPPA